MQFKEYFNPLNWLSLERRISRIEYLDEYVAGEWLYPQGVAAPDEVTVTIGGVPYRLKAFDGVNTQERMANSFEINHNTAINMVNKEEKQIEWHVHFMPSTNDAGKVKFFLDYCYLPAYGEPIPQTTISFIYDIPENSQYYHLLAGNYLPVPSSKFNIGGLILFDIRRNPGDIEDTYTNDILFIKTALHIPTDGRGSRERYIK